MKEDSMTIKTEKPKPDPLESLPPILREAATTTSERQGRYTLQMHGGEIFTFRRAVIISEKWLHLFGSDGAGEVDVRLGFVLWVRKTPAGSEDSTPEALASPAGNTVAVPRHVTITE